MAIYLKGNSISFAVDERFLRSLEIFFVSVFHATDG